MITYTTSAVKLREYDRIFTGSNQEEGYESPCLGFRSDTIRQTFVADELTYFHYPFSADEISLSATDLIQAGAIAGPTPHRADKVWKKQADYKKYIWWGNSTYPTPGTWLCAWLSGNVADPAQEPIWLDRWYNPGYIDEVTASFVTNTPAVYDAPSILTFDPGVWYKYFHVGEITNDTFVNSLSSVLRLHVDDWDQPTKDLSTYDNQIVLLNYSPNMISETSVNPNNKDTSLNLYTNGQYAKVLHNDTFALTDKMTCSFWAYAEDWCNIYNSYSILSKNFRGGWKFRFNNGFYTPIFALIGTNNKILIGNNNGQIYFTRTLPNNSGWPRALTIDNDLYVWVIDNSNYNSYKHLYKMDFDGNIILQKEFPSTTDLMSITLDMSGNVWILDSTTNTVSGFHPYDTSCIGLSAITDNVSAVAFDLNGDLHVVDGISVFDTSNNQFILSGNKIFKETNTPYITNMNVQAFTSDRYDNLWIIASAKEIYKIDNTGQIVTSSILVLNDNETEYSISLINELNEVTKEYEDYCWITCKDNEIVNKYNDKFRLIKSIDTTIYNTAPKAGESTSYQWNKKFNYMSNRLNKQPVIEFQLYTGVAIPSSIYTLSQHSTAIANQKWHMFTFTYNNTAQEMRFYIDAILCDSITIPSPYKIFYNYENPLFIGSEAGKITNLREELEYRNSSFIGKIDDIRIYSHALNNSDIRNLYMTKFDFKDIQWNMPTGIQNYIEEIERFFKFKLPGQKSQYYNIKLVGLQITDESIREMIEDIIKDTVKKIAPAYTELYNIVWE